MAVGDGVDDHHALRLGIVEAAAGHKTHGLLKPLLAAGPGRKPAHLGCLLCSERTCTSIKIVTGCSKSIDIPNTEYDGLPYSALLPSASVLTSCPWNRFPKSMPSAFGQCHRLFQGQCPSQVRIWWAPSQRTTAFCNCTHFQSMG